MKNSVASLGLEPYAAPGGAMPVPDAPDSAVQPCLRLTLQRRHSPPGWQAELQDQGATRRFESLTDLMAWLCTLEGPPSPPSPPTRGIR